MAKKAIAKKPAKKKQTKKQLRLTTEKVRDLARVDDDRLANVIGGRLRPTVAESDDCTI